MTNNVYFALLGYIFWVVLYLGWDYAQEQDRLYQQVDSVLRTNALATQLILPQYFHRLDMQPGDIQPAADLRNTLRLSRLIEHTEIAYVYSLIKHNNQVYFTSSSATSEELQAGQELYSYFDPYDDVDPRVEQLFSNPSQLFLDIRDQWGHFRSVFIPQTSADGRLFLLAADIDISYIKTLLNQRLWQQLVLATIFLLFMLPVIFTFSAAQRRWAKELEVSVRERTEALHSSEKRLESIIEHSPVGIFHYDRYATVTMVNHRFEVIIGAQEPVLLGFNLLNNLTNTDLLAAVRDSLQGKVGRFEGPYTSILGGRSIYLIADFVPLLDNQGEVNGGVAVFNDLTEQHSTNETLKKLSMAVEQSPSMVVITDINGTIEYVNARFTEITGYTATDVLGKSPRLLKSGETATEIYAELWKTLLAGKTWNGMLQNQKKNGELYWADETISPITNDAGEITHFISQQEDITEVRRIADEMNFQTTHDPLTGLLNRQQFEHELARVIEHTQQYHTHHVLCFIDIDQFKIINDTCGHMAGDELLRRISQLIRDRISNRDTLARPAGDEFLLLFEGANLAQGESVLQSIINDLKSFRFQWEEHHFTIEISAGITSIDQHTRSPLQAMQDVDTACYSAKDAGRNRVHIYSESDEQQLIHKGYVQWANEIHRALDENRFQLYAQPIVPLQEEQKIGYEILLRLLSDADKIIAPDAFLPAAERYNIAPQIDRWVIHHSLQWIANNIDRLDHVASLAINLSGQSLGDNSLLQFIIDHIEQGTVPARMIKFEITETAAIANLNNAQKFIHALKQLGCQFALDDFGSGLSSFAYLKSLPVDLLKIDGMFVRNIITDPIDEAMVRSINEVGHIMGMQTIAEFVETDEMMERLKTIGVDYAQGYAISRPLPIDSILKDN
ncbi:EAL domain-containing protein [Amphritea sp. 1_MG-2023]|uniref:bifunctional diguanylate cyclase/phosphodiesterase n=1 Tax=Amphritea sp. 1_MG-2023 TaxID=3062670 RepID=UPI0026E2A457|nr:bifunctional diguanylate cyclase/phosphodiesterase [Amphritea sp. 1_MG-2023]MDO6564810.1 EAL domain-containing protein [Amphritea sp. 1_MG-2023]